MDKLDFYQAAKLTLANNLVLQEFYENEENITLKNIDQKSGEEIYDIVESGLSIGYLQKDGELATTEEAFRLSTDAERKTYGPRHFVGAKKSYIINSDVKNIIIEAAEIEGNPELEEWELD